MTGSASHAATEEAGGEFEGGHSASDLEFLQALNELHESEIARRAARIALERAEDQVMRGIAVAMHEDVEHALITTKAKLQMLRDQIGDDQQAKAVARMEETLGRAAARMQRLVLEVRPLGLERNGLGATLKAYLESAKQAWGLDFDLSNELHNEPQLDVQVTLFRIAQEAIDNTRKYAGATLIELSVREYAGGFLLHVGDNGSGFDPDTVERERIGLTSMRERAEVRDGWLQLHSKTGEGTSIDAWIPGNSRYQKGEATPDSEIEIF